MRQMDVTFVRVCGGGELENNFVRQFISLNIFKHETFSLIDKYGENNVELQHLRSCRNL